MSRHPFDPRELDQPAADRDPSVDELERYVMTADAGAPHGLSDRIMAAIEGEPAPRRGFLAWLGAPSSTGGGPRRLLRVGALAATLVLAVAGALFAGQLADLVRDVGGNATPTPSVSPSPSETTSTSPSPSPSIEPSPSATPEGSDDHGGSGAAPTALPTPDEETSGDASEETITPRPSPTVTASPTQTPNGG
jgi:hypothetical protein